jgi:hypothetical protein
MGDFNGRRVGHQEKGESEGDTNKHECFGAIGRFQPDIFTLMGVKTSPVRADGVGADRDQVALPEWADGNFCAIACMIMKFPGQPVFSSVTSPA